MELPSCSSIIFSLNQFLTIKACKVIGQRFTTAIHFLLNLASQKRLELPIAVAKLEKLSHYGRYRREIIEDATKRLKGGN